MALPKCKKCSQEVGKSAVVCTNCGEKRDPVSIITKIALGLLSILIVIFIFGSISASLHEDEYKTASTQEEQDYLTDQNKQDILVLNAKDYVRSRLKDAESAQFKNVFYSNASGSPVVCGQVNSKNAYGGYGGYKYFVSESPELTFFEGEVDDFAKIWNKLCKS